MTTQTGGHYRTDTRLDGTAVPTWIPAPRWTARDIAWRRAFPNGVPLRGPLTPEQQRALADR